MEGLRVVHAGRGGELNWGLEDGFGWRNLDLSV